MSDNEQDLELRAFRIHAPAQKALQEILNALQSSTDVFYAVRSRVKPVKAILEKTQRKRREGGREDYQPEDITDIVGVRVVTLFREDVIDALKIFLGLIKHQGTHFTKSPFTMDSLKEGLIYTNATVGDPEAITSRLRSVFETFGFPIKDANIMQVETGYSSIHLVAFCSVKQDNEIVQVPIEIQIRTVFEDAWGEIDHKLRYSIYRSRVEPERLIESWQPHLNVLKTFTDGCSQYAGIIKSQAIDVHARPGTYLIVPVDDPENALKSVGKSSPKLQAAFRKAYEARALAMSSAASGTSAAAEKMFREAVEAFSVAGELIPTSTFDSDRERDVASFLVTMERAFCLLSIGKKETLDEAIKLYSEAQEMSPESVVVYYRYAQALVKLNELDAAITKYQKAESLLSADRYVPRDHWLHTVIPRMLGFALWAKSRAQPPDADGRAERIRLLVQAYGYSKKACQFAALHKTSTTISRLRNANNVLHYAAEYLDLNPDGAEITKEEVREHLIFLEKNLDLGRSTRQQLNFIDTLCRASLLFGKIEQALMAAERIEHLLSTPPATTVSPRSIEDDSELREASQGPGPTFYATISHLNEKERDMLDHALWVLRRHGTGPDGPRKQRKSGKSRSK
ncbi:tetratricopeptide repeat protein [Bradyrhizobium elkanii]|uniref:Tetratricopeptide repeat protein n=1 Tax=Bradyrhizobium elkanii TaxID=29448 RepID=A0A4U6RXX0_BRAEL|nr:tetratricopeptide repeat protein [Bradyrhizobium elkanii]TKV80097.1 tetratricopeptide repeat protein [Bradyrhizobium elkanii]